MRLNVSAWSIRHPLPAILFAIVTVLLGALSFTKLPITRLPNVDLPVVSVTISQFGAAPAELEAQVTKSVEDAVSGVEGVRHIRSSITDGLSVTTIDFRLETNTDRALNDVKDAVTRVRANLPRNIDEPLIQRVDVVGLSIVTYAAISPGKTPEQLSYFVDEVVKRHLISDVPVGVPLSGGLDSSGVVSTMSRLMSSGTDLRMRHAECLARAFEGVAPVRQCEREPPQIHKVSAEDIPRIRGSAGAQFSHGLWKRSRSPDSRS